MREVAVVGGGLLGMTLAYRLAEGGHRVTLLEAAPEAGGLAAPQMIGAFTWDRFYHVLLESDRHLVGLLGELGLRDAVTWGTTRTGFYTDGRYHSMSTSLEFLRFPPLGLVAKARLAATILRASRIRDGLPLEAETAEAWLRRWSGRATFERIWRPLLRSKLGANWDRVSAAFIWAIIARMYAARRSGLKRERFGYLPGGHSAVVRALRATLDRQGVAMVTGAAVAAVESHAGRVAVTTAGGRRVEADAAVLTIPARRIAALCPQLSAAERDRLARVEYQGVICTSVLLDRPLAGYYVTNITDEGFPFTTVVEMTALVDPAAFGGLTLAYLPRYCTPDDPWWERGDADVVEAVLAGLRRLHPTLPPEAVRHAAVARARDVQALPTLHFSRDALPPLRTSVPGVFLVNSAQIVNGTLNSNETVALAERQARALQSAFGPA